MDPLKMNGSSSGPDKISIDDLYDRTRNHTVNTFELFKKILNRVHVRIRTTSSQYNETCCWYTIPSIIIGLPRFNHTDCVAYVVDALKTNGFRVQLYPPNVIFVYWGHWVPRYVREEVKRRTGVVLDEVGQVVSAPNAERDQAHAQAHQQAQAQQLPATGFRAISSYRPTGKLGGGV
jgi:hypothetical protein